MIVSMTQITSLALFAFVKYNLSILKQKMNKSRDEKFTKCEEQDLPANVLDLGLLKYSVVGFLDFVCFDVYV